MKNIGQSYWGEITTGLRIPFETNKYMIYNARGIRLFIYRHENESAGDELDYDDESDYNDNDHRDHDNDG